MLQLLWILLYHSHCVASELSSVILSIFQFSSLLQTLETTDVDRFNFLRFFFNTSSISGNIPMVSTIVNTRLNSLLFILVVIVVVVFPLKDVFFHRSLSDSKSLQVFRILLSIIFSCGLDELDSSTNRQFTQSLFQVLRDWTKSHDNDWYHRQYVPPLFPQAGKVQFFAFSHFNTGLLTRQNSQ